ncbi:hypothetical protein [Marinobacter salexigens]|uniref:Uncharacterized protein n=1 Tax=Marinobacter salexigens TaxID=1925763 RepID=A0ABS6AA97_9GAMM|nr:hypothetical protein [Marinobacter salexigens]MBU2875115.1 hypothetical protein [Marinobacter salexigens]
MTAIRGGVLLVAASMAAPVGAAVFEFTGSAARNDGRVLYEEEHRTEGQCEQGVFQPVKHHVTYHPFSSDKDSSGKDQPFAEKWLDYSSSVVRPAVNFRQPDFNELLEITYPAEDIVNLVWQQPGGDTSRSTLEISNDLVVDAGFDNFVRRNWQKVINGESVKFRFLAPTRGTDYAFVLEPAQSQTVKADHLVQIRPDSFMLNFLVDPIILGYSKKGVLTVYSGLTNVRENADQNFTATIRYNVTTYPECELTP